MADIDLTDEAVATATAALKAHPWNTPPDHPNIWRLSEHRNHTSYARCAVCTGDVGAVVPVVLAAAGPLIAAQVRAQVAEEIARAIEVGYGDRCPTCGGKPASTSWVKGTGRKRGRCGGGHTWELRSRDWCNPVEVARARGRADKLEANHADR